MRLQHRPVVPGWRSLYFSSMCACTKATTHHTRPSINRKEGLVNGAGWKCTLQISKPVEFCAEPDTHTSILFFPAWCLQHSKTKQSAKTVLVWLAFPINAHQNVTEANRKCAFIPGAVYTSTPSFTRLSFLIFEGLAPRLQSNPHGLLSFMGALPRKQNLYIAVEVKVQQWMHALWCE